MKKLLFSCCLFCTVLTNAASADFTRVDSLLNSAISDKIVPGAVLFVSKGDSIIYSKAYGNRQIVPVKGQASDLPMPIPMTEDTVFDMASCTKVACTTIAVMQLWEKGKIKLEASVGKYLKAFRGQDLRVIDLLTHTSGYLGDKWKKQAGYSRFTDCGAQAPAELIKYLATESPRIPSGSKYAYACSNFFILQQIVERLTGERLCDYAHEHIYAPLKMSDTRFLPIGEYIPEEYFSRIAPEYARAEIGQVNDTFARRICRGNAGNAGLFSTAEDMSRFCVALMNGGGGILKPATVDKMSRVVDPIFGRAVGWDVHSPKSRLKGHSLDSESIVHGGYTGTMVAIDMKNKISIVILANRCHPVNANYQAWLNVREVISTAIGNAVLSENR